MNEKIIFDQKTYQNRSDIQADLLSAARGNPHTNDRDLIHDPMWWSHLFLDSVKGSFLEREAGQVLYEMVKSQDTNIQQFALRLLLDYPFAQGADFLALLQDAYQKKDIETCRLLASRLVQISLQKRFSYTPLCREFVPDLTEELFLLYFLYDTSWLTEKIAILLPKEEQEAIFFIKRVFTRLSERPLQIAELMTAYQALKPGLSSLPSKVQETISSLLEEAVAKKERFEKSRFHNFSELVGLFSSGFGREAMEGFDESSLALLQGEERMVAEDILIGELEKGRNDPRICSALYAMKSQRAVPTLKNRSQGFDETASASASALWKLTKDPTAILSLLKIIQSNVSAEVRNWAFCYLDEFINEIPQEQIRPALFSLLFDKNVEIRQKAVDLLSKSLGVDTLEHQANSKLFRLSARLLNSLLAVWENAAKEMTDIFHSLSTGTSAEALGLVPKDNKNSEAFLRFRLSVFGDVTKPNPSPAQELDIDAFSTLADEERAWGEQFILQLIADKDVRALEAIKKLKATWALSALQESASQKSKFAKEAQKILGVLRKETP